MVKAPIRESWMPQVSHVSEVAVVCVTRQTTGSFPEGVAHMKPWQEMTTRLFPLWMIYA